MKILQQTVTIFSLGTIIAIASVFAALPVYAAGAAISLSANKASVANGSSVVIAIYMNGGGNPVNGVEADLSYPASQLQYVGISSTGSAFEISAAANGGNGAVTIDRGTTGSVSGGGLIATVTFKALVDSGSANISVGGNSALVNAGSAIPFSASGAVVKLTSYTAPAAAAVVPSAPVAPVAPKDTTPPIITDVHVKTRTPYSAVIDWTTNEASDSAIDYGPDPNYGLTVSTVTMGTSHELTLNSAFLSPATTLHYRVKSADAAGNVATGIDQNLTLPGVPVTIVVRGDTGQAQANATVSIDNQSAVTDSKGQAQLSTGLGNKQVVITYDGVTIHKPITINRSTKPLPPIQLDVSKQPLNRWMLLSIGLIIVVIVLLGLDALLFGSSFVMHLFHARQRQAQLRHINQNRTEAATTTLPVTAVTVQSPSLSANIPVASTAPAAPSASPLAPVELDAVEQLMGPVAYSAPELPNTVRVSQPTTDTQVIVHKRTPKTTLAVAQESPSATVAKRLKPRKI